MEPKTLGSELQYIEEVNFGGGIVGKFHLFFGDPLVIKAKLKNIPVFPAALLWRSEMPPGDVCLFSQPTRMMKSTPTRRKADVAFNMTSVPTRPGNITSIWR